MWVFLRPKEYTKQRLPYKALKNDFFSRSLYVSLAQVVLPSAMTIFIFYHAADLHWYNYNASVALSCFVSQYDAAPTKCMRCIFPQHPQIQIPCFTANIRIVNICSFFFPPELCQLYVREITYLAIHYSSIS